MLKLKNNVVDFIYANVKPEFVNNHIEMLIDNQPSPTWPSRWRFDSRHTIHGKTIYFNLNKDDFEEVEELKPNVWYTADKFDWNPKDYWLAETTELGGCFLYPNEYNQNKRLRDETTHFMYIEKLETNK